VGKLVVFDGAPDRRCYRSKLVVGEVNCRHGSDIIGRHLSSKEAFVREAFMVRENDFERIKAYPVRALLEA
jgi:hypothetical protein